MQFFSADAATLFLEYIYFAPDSMKKLPSNVAHNLPKPFFSVLPTDPKSAQISYFFHSTILVNLGLDMLYTL